jgi:anti-sigma B factor antagonist
MTTRPFSAAVRRQDGAEIIDLHGEINGFAETALNQAYTQAEESLPAAVILNFADVSYINSTGIALIVSLMARSRKSHRRLAVYGLSEHYVEIFQITRLVDFLTLYPDETSALAETIA